MRQDHRDLLSQLEIPDDSPVLWIPMAYRDEHDMAYEAVPMVPISCCKHMESTCAMCIDIWLNDYLVMKVWLDEARNLSRFECMMAMLDIPGREYPAELPDN